MGLFHQTIAIAANPEGPYRELEAMVDTGSLYTWVPGSMLRPLGAEPTATRKFELADGSIIDRDIAWIAIRLGTEVSPTVCVF